MFVGIGLAQLFHAVYFAAPTHPLWERVNREDRTNHIYCLVLYSPVMASVFMTSLL